MPIDVPQHHSTLDIGTNIEHIGTHGVAIYHSLVACLWTESVLFWVTLYFGVLSKVVVVMRPGRFRWYGSPSWSSKGVYKYLVHQMNHAGYASGLVISVVKSSMMSALCLWPLLHQGLRRLLWHTEAW